MDPERREVWLLIRDAVQRADGTFDVVWRDIDRIIRQLPDRPLTKADHRILRRRIDTVLNRAFGLTQATAPRSALYRAILQSTDAAAAAPLTTMLRRLEDDLTRRSPELWRETRDTLLRVNPEGDRLARVYQAMNGPVVQRERFLRSGLLDPQRRWVHPNGYRLSDRVWKQGRIVRRNIDDVIRQGVRKGESPAAIAEILEQYLNPSQAPTRYLKNGRIVERGVTYKPSFYGYGSSRARTLARTEVSRIHAEATKRAALASPGVDGITWNLSGSHGRSDECDDKASGSSSGFDAGTYLVQDFPMMPSHVSCICYSTQHTISRDKMIDALVDKYDLEAS